MPTGPFLLGSASRGRACCAPARSRGRQSDWTAALLLCWLGGGLLIRLGLAGATGTRDPRAGAAFGLVLLVAAWGAGWRPASPSGRDLAAGAAGTALLVAAPLVAHLLHPGPALGAGVLGWAPVVVLVAVAEEALLRGALWEAVVAGHGERAALAVTTLAFGLLHVPLYGVRALPLDLAAGLVLGGLRQWSGRVAAPAFAHTAADLAGWWLR